MEMNSLVAHVSKFDIENDSIIVKYFGTLTLKKYTAQLHFMYLHMIKNQQSNRVYSLSVCWSTCLVWTSCKRVPRQYKMTSHTFNTLRPRQNGRSFADDTFKSIFLNENVRISIKISLKFVPKVSINNIPALVQIMAWRRLGDKPLSEPMMVGLLTHICVTRPQWVNVWSIRNNIFILIQHVWGKLLTSYCSSLLSTICSKSYLLTSSENPLINTGPMSLAFWRLLESHGPSYLTKHPSIKVDFAQHSHSQILQITYIPFHPNHVHEKAQPYPI